MSRRHSTAALRRLGLAAYTAAAKEIMNAHYHAFTGRGDNYDVRRLVKKYGFSQTESEALRRIADAIHYRYRGSSVYPDNDYSPDDYDPHFDAIEREAFRRRGESGRKRSGGRKRHSMRRR